MYQYIQSEGDGVSGCSLMVIPKLQITPEEEYFINSYTDSSSKEDFDLSLSDPLGLDYLPGLSGVDLDWPLEPFGDGVDESSAAFPVSPPSPKASNTLRHDCMWSGHCLDVEQHRGSSYQLPPLFSRPNDTSSILLSTFIRTETPSFRNSEIGEIQNKVIE